MNDFPRESDGSWWTADEDGRRRSTDRVDPWDVSPIELKKRMTQGDDVLLLDVREPWEADLAQISGSRLIPLGELEFRAEQELDPDQEIVIYCHHGIRSLEGAIALWNLGYEHVKNLAGGIDRWASQVEPEMTRY